MAVPEATEYDYVTLADVARFKHHKRKTSTNSLLSTTSSYNAGGGGSVRLSDDAWSYTNSSIGTWETADLGDEMNMPEVGTMPEVVEEEGEQQTELPAKASPGENENGGLLANPDKKVRLEQKNK